MLRNAIYAKKNQFTKLIEQSVINVEKLTKFVRSVVHLLMNILSKIFSYLKLRPSCRRNDPYAKIKQQDPLEEILKNLKERHKRTVERKIQDGEDIIFDDEKGIINDETGEVVVDIKIIRGDFNVDNYNDETDAKDDSRKDGQDKSSKEQGGLNIQKIVENNIKNKKDNPDEEEINTFKDHDKEDFTEEGDYEDDSDEEDKEINQ